MPHVTRGEIGAMSDDNAGDERITNFAGAAALPATGSDESRRRGCIAIKIQNPILKSCIEDSGEAVFELLATTAGRTYFNSVAQFEKRDGR